MLESSASVKHIKESMKTQKEIGALNFDLAAKEINPNKRYDNVKPIGTASDRMSESPIYGAPPGSEAAMWAYSNINSQEA